MKMKNFVTIMMEKSRDAIKKACISISKDSFQLNYKR